MKRKFINLEEIKIENINLVFDIIRKNDGITRTELAKGSGLSSMTITRIILELLQNNVVYEDGEIMANRGRPAKKIYINTNCFYTLSICIDVDVVLFAVLDLKNNILLQEELESNNIYKMEEYVDLVYNKFLELIKENKGMGEKISCISIVCSGVIDKINGEIIISAQLKWRNVKIVDYVEEKFGITTIIDNDVKSALVGEVNLWEEYKNMSIAYMDIGYGIGVGFWNGGQVLRGANNRAGEIGHITINYNGLKCECGKKGCLNTVLNIESFLLKAKEYDAKINTIKDIKNKYKEGVKWAQALIDDVCKYFSIAIDNIVYIYDPDMIIIGGKFISQFPDFLEVLTLSKHYSNGDYRIDVRLNLSEQGEKSYIIGSAINSQKTLIT